MLGKLGRVGDDVSSAASETVEPGRGTDILRDGRASVEH
jgi:hypothetical protein